jgi:hypothetical protein
LTAASQSPAGPTCGALHKRRPGLAALLSLFWPGLGQLYNRQIAKGLLLIFGLPILAKIGLGYAFLGAFEAMRDLRYLLVTAAGGLILVAGAALWIYAVVDAHRCSEKNAPSPAMISGVDFR